jgi:hypothetical protein
VAIAANVTAVGNQAIAAGNVVAYATGADEPASSLANFTPGTNSVGEPSGNRRLYPELPGPCSRFFDR